MAESNIDVLFADLVVAQKDISFQDMQSISRAFRELLGVDVARSDDANDVILGQAGRHVVVHAGGIIDARMVRQVSGASPRRLKQTIALGDQLSFEPDEIRALAESMKRYIDALVTRIAISFGKAVSDPESA